jgi:uncharacterized membrane protein (DUF485 family)
MVRTDFHWCDSSYVLKISAAILFFRHADTESATSVSTVANQGGNVAVSKTPLSGGNSTWSRVANSADFRKLLASKKAFVLPATIFFVVYYFALPVLVGYAPDLMQKKIIGPVNLAYLFALSQFAVVFIITYLYVRAARRFDEASAGILAEAGQAFGKDN